MGGFTHDAQIFTIWRAFECIILMIITCSGGVFHILFTLIAQTAAPHTNIIISQPVTWPIIKCTYLSVMCQLMPRAYGFYHFPWKHIFFLFASLSVSVSFSPSPSLSRCLSSIVFNVGWHQPRDSNNNNNNLSIIIMGCYVAKIMLRLFTVIVKFGGSNLMDFVLPLSPNLNDSLHLPSVLAVFYFI